MSSKYLNQKEFDRLTREGQKLSAIYALLLNIANTKEAEKSKNREK